MIVLTGASGFVGSRVLAQLNSMGHEDILLFDDLSHGDQFRNLIDKKYKRLYSLDDIPQEDLSNVECVIHCGAISSTLEKDWNKIYKYNVRSTRFWHDLCLENNIKFIFTSSAAIYGNGDGPLNHYAFSKMTSENEMTNGVALRLFNVYGPGESHKGRMSSTPYHWYNQLKERGSLRLFDNSENYFRDFIWVDDVARSICHFIDNYYEGTYELGTGRACSFDDLAKHIIEHVGGEIEPIHMPDDLKSQYQTYTEAQVDSLINVGIDVDQFIQPREGVKLYCKYLDSKK